MGTILIVEDERDLAELVAFNLEREGHNTILAFDGISGLNEALRLNPDLILLDLLLPGLTGMEVCKQLRVTAKTAAIPVIMVTARGEVTDKVAGFEVGADDYVVKPFSARELLLRVKAVLRRGKGRVAVTSGITVGPIMIDAASHRVTLNGAALPLTTMEFKLLLTLAQRVGRVQSRTQLLRDVWGYSYVDDSRTVDTHLTRLRTKMGDAGELIRTVRGFGYVLEGG